MPGNGVALRCPTAPSTTGSYTLTWDGPPGATFVLQEGRGPGAKTIYRGPAQATTLSGQADGAHDYRLGVAAKGRTTAWAAHCRVHVQAPSLGLAAAFFAIGFIVVLVTVVAVIRGHRRHQRGELG